MAVTLGKRKRRGDLGESGSDSSSEEDVRSLFQRAFEAKFKPLKKDERPKGPTAETEAVNLSDELENSDWSGLSDDEEGQGGDIEVVNHDVVQAEDEEARRQEMKAFMVRVYSHSTIPLLTEPAVLETANITTKSPY